MSARFTLPKEMRVYQKFEPTPFFLYFNGMEISEGTKFVVSKPIDRFAKGRPQLVMRIERGDPYYLLVEEINEELEALVKRWSLFRARMFITMDNKMWERMRRRATHYESEITIALRPYLSPVLELVSERSEKV
jgi:hypothetical protein